MNTKNYKLALLILTVVGCSTNDSKTEILQKQILSDTQLTDKKVLTENINFDTLLVDKESAVLYSPDKTQIEERKKSIGEENFLIGAGDYINYMHISYDFLDSSKIIVLDAKNKKYLKFIYSDKTQNLIKLDTLPELWGIYFFKPSKKEKLIDITSTEDEFKIYFK